MRNQLKVTDMVSSIIEQHYENEERKYSLELEFTFSAEDTNLRKINNILIRGVYEDNLKELLQKSKELNIPFESEYYCELGGKNYSQISNDKCEFIRKKEEKGDYMSFKVYFKIKQITDYQKGFEKYRINGKIEIRIIENNDEEKHLCKAEKIVINHFLNPDSKNSVFKKLKDELFQICTMDDRIRVVFKKEHIQREKYTASF